MISNVTVSVGREATFTCIVDDLGSYRVRTKISVMNCFIIGKYFFCVYFIPLDNFRRDKITPETEISRTHMAYEKIFSAIENFPRALVRIIYWSGGSTRSYRDTIAKCYYLSSDLMSFPHRRMNKIQEKYGRSSPRFQPKLFIRPNLQFIAHAQQMIYNKAFPILRVRRKIGTTLCIIPAEIARLLCFVFYSLYVWFSPKENKHFNWNITNLAFRKFICYKVLFIIWE